jgi:hypothetical protein
MVRCTNEAGSNTDTRFVLAVFDTGTPSTATVMGFAYANDSASASYTPQESRSNNATGDGTLTGTRSGVGTYQMQFHGQSLIDIGNVQVTAYNRVDGSCWVQSYSGEGVNVRCFDSDGDPADMGYLVSAFGQKEGSTAGVVATAIAEDDGASSYTPVETFNAGGGAVTASRTAAGTYAIQFEGSSFNTGAHVQVNAYGLGRHCNVAAWAGDTVNITCANASGTLTDSPYAIVVLQEG